MNKYQQIAEEVSQKYKNYEKLEGIIWIGSSTFGIYDKDADIDVRLVIDSKQKIRPMEKLVYDGIKVEVDDMSWDWLMGNLQPDSDQYWMREKGIITFDPQNKLQTAFTKLKQQMTVNHNDDLWRMYKEIFSDYEIEKCLKRGENEAGELYVFQSINSLLKFVYVLKNQPVPPLKWRWHFLNKTKLIGDEMKNKINSLILDHHNLSEKLVMIKQLQSNIQELMVKEGFEEKKVKEYWRY